MEYLRDKVEFLQADLLDQARRCRFTRPDWDVGGGQVPPKLAEIATPGPFFFCGDVLAELRQAAEGVNARLHHIDPPGSRVRDMLRALRPHQWSKNLLMFLPALAAHDLGRLLPVLLGFLAFSLTASAVYVINDLLDLAADRAHPRKCQRPFAAGDLPASTGAAMAAGLLLAALILGLLTGNPVFLAVLSLYLAATFAYSFWLKRKLIVDVITLAGLYSIRIVAGAVAAGGLVLSPWLLGWSK